MSRDLGHFFTGIYVPEMPPETRALLAVEAALGCRFDVVSFFQAWGSRYRAFDASWFRAALDLGRVPMVAWEPWMLPDELGGERAHAPHEQPSFALRAIVRGDHDAYVRDWARGLARLDREVWLRPLHEMNGSWYPWAGTVNGNEPCEFADAWKHVVSIFRGEGAARVKWVFSPYATSYPTTAANHVARYYPGDDWVDLVGIDAFNWHDAREGARWADLEDLAGTCLAEVRTLTARPIFIAETACPPSARRSAWIRAAFEWARREALAGLVWFNADKECDWRLESDSASLAAWRASLTNPFA